MTIRHPESAVADGTGDAGVTLSQIVDEGNGRTWQAVVRNLRRRPSGPDPALGRRQRWKVISPFPSPTVRVTVCPQVRCRRGPIHTPPVRPSPVPAERQRHVRGLARGSVEVNGLTHGDDTIVPGAGLQRRRAADGDCRCLRHPLLAVIDLELDRERPDRR